MEHAQMTNLMQQSVRLDNLPPNLEVVEGWKVK